MWESFTNAQKSTAGVGKVSVSHMVVEFFICFFILSGLLVFLWHFQDSMLSLAFGNLISMCLGEGFFDLSYLGFTQILESVSLCLFTNLGNFQPLFLGVFF